MKKIMRWGLFALGLFAVASFASAQDEQALRDNYKHKLEKEFVSKIDWVQSYDQARATAKKQGKLVLGYFSRSYQP